MDKRVGLVALAVVSGLVLAACGGDDGDSGGMGNGMNGGGMGHDGEDRAVVAGAREIPVEATSFEFSPDEITVAAGENVAIVLESDDVFHDFAVEGVGHVVGADGDETAEGGLRIDEPGTYEFWCTVSGHRRQGMEGTIVVG